MEVSCFICFLTGSKIVNEEGMRETVDEVDGCIADTLKLVRSNTFVISKNSQQLNTN